jgi:hypothetical protein
MLHVSNARQDAQTQQADVVSSMVPSRARTKRMHHAVGGTRSVTTRSRYLEYHRSSNGVEITNGS